MEALYEDLGEKRHDGMNWSSAEVEPYLYPRGPVDCQLVPSRQTDKLQFLAISSQYSYNIVNTLQLIHNNMENKTTMPQLFFGLKWGCIINVRKAMIMWLASVGHCTEPQKNFWLIFSDWVLWVTRGTCKKDFPTAKILRQ